MRIGIAGYGNLGRGVEYALQKCNDMELRAIVTRREPSTLTPVTEGVPVYEADSLEKLQQEIDVMILCGGSATDLPEQGPAYAKYFNTVDSFDTHAKIPTYFDTMDAAAKAGKHISIFSVGWDPGLFSLNRLYAEAVLPQGESYTFWGRGVSQGHSDAIRRIPGVKNAIQYTVPIPSAMEAVRSGICPVLTTAQKHKRECFVVPEKDADLGAIQKAICEMPNYFAEYETIVHFISEKELQEEHNKMPHGGFVMRSGITAEHTKQMIEYSLKLDSNPEFTAGVLVCYARAAFRLAQKGETGARTVFDIAPALLSPKSSSELRAQLL